VRRIDVSTISTFSFLRVASLVGWGCGSRRGAEPFQRCTPQFASGASCVISSQRLGMGGTGRESGRLAAGCWRGALSAHRPDHLNTSTVCLEPRACQPAQQTTTRSDGAMRASQASAAAVTTRIAFLGAAMGLVTKYAPVDDLASSRSGARWAAHR
jgi:hypothetical protein